MGGGPLPEDTRPVSELFSASTPDRCATARHSILDYRALDYRVRD
jgi:hypothetical protein